MSIEGEKPRPEHPFRTAKRMMFHARKTAAEKRYERREGAHKEGDKVLPVGRRGQVLLLAIALYANAGGVTSFGGQGGPSQRLLGATVGYSERAVRMAVQELEAAGLVERDVPSPSERREGKRTEYTIPLWTWRPDRSDTASSVAEARGAPPPGSVAAAVVASVRSATILHDPKGPAAEEGRQNARQTASRPLLDRATAAVASLAARSAADAPRGVSPNDRQPLPVLPLSPTGFPPTPRGGGRPVTPDSRSSSERVAEIAAKLAAAAAARSG